MCKVKDPNTNKQCQARGPFEIHVKARVTAAIIEWVSLVFSTHENVVIFLQLVLSITCIKCFPVCPEPFSALSSRSCHLAVVLTTNVKIWESVGSNILLSRNNYTKVKLLFRFMNIGMIIDRYFADIQENYCVNTIKDFWNAKRAKVISEVKTSRPTVVLGW